MNETAKRLRAADTRQQAAEILSGLSKADLREAARALGYHPLSRDTKTDLQGLLIESVGAREDWNANLPRMRRYRRL